MASQQLNALKTINNIQRDGSLQNLLLSIKQAKVDIDAFSKSIQERKTKLQAQQQAKQREEEARKAELEKAEKAKEAEALKAEQEKVETAQKEESKPKETKKEENKIFSQGNNQNNNFRKFDGQNNNNRFQRNGNNFNNAGNQQGRFQQKGILVETTLTEMAMLLMVETHRGKVDKIVLKTILLCLLGQIISNLLLQRQQKAVPFWLSQSVTLETKINKEEMLMKAKE